MDIKIDVSWFRFLADLPPEEIKQVVRAIWDYTHGDEQVKVDCAAWETIKASIDFEKQRKKEISEKRRAAILARWNKVNESVEQPKKEVIEPEVIPQNKFMKYTDSPEILSALQDSNSALSVFLDTGSRYDELSVEECKFADRSDVRAQCKWHRELQEKAREIKAFTPPTEEEVLAYAREQDSMAMCGGFSCSEDDARNFYDYYAGIGWKLPNNSNTPMRAWKPFFRKWCLRDRKLQNKNKPSAFEEMLEGSKMAKEILKQRGLI